MDWAFLKAKESSWFNICQQIVGELLIICLSY